MENRDEERAPKTIKAMPVRAWNRALAQAAKSGESMAEWLTRAIDQLADREAGERVLPPPAPQPGPSVRDNPAAGMAPQDMAELMQAAVAAAQASGVPLPKSVARHAFALVGGQLRAARGLPPVKPRLPAGQTPLRIGQTVSQDAEQS